MSVTPFYLSGTAGRLHATHFAPTNSRAESAAILVLPPFAEEMNKSRPMIAKVARRFSKFGLGTLVVDPLGTGDSTGDFADATWEQWISDFRGAWEWLNSSGYRQVHLLAIRTGALLVSAVSDGRNTTTSQLVMWQPVTKGADYWRQFLRMRIAADAMRDQTARVSPQEQLRQDGSIEIAGYTIALKLADSLAGAELGASTPRAFQRTLWAEVSLTEPAALSMGSQRTLGQWQIGAEKLQTAAIKGEHFWSTPEIAFVPALVDITCDFLAGDAR